MSEREALHQAWLTAKAHADRLYWQLHGPRINARRRQRYAQDLVFREKQRERARERQKWLKQKALN
jgi:hypothetical protein